MVDSRHGEWCVYVERLSWMEKLKIERLWKCQRNC